MKRKIAVCNLCILFCVEMACGFSVAHAQPHVISGKITDLQTGEPLVSATAQIYAQNIGTTSDSIGQYLLEIPVSRGQIEIRYSFVGYRPVRKRIQLAQGKETKVNVKLSPLVYKFDQLTVEAKTIRKRLETATTGLVHIPARRLTTVPSVGGERDVLRAIQLLPGVKLNNELSTGYHVRGGGESENLILLDGMPVYNPWHFFGIFGAFNPDILQEVALMKGAFPAEYGGRLSSVLNLETIDGEREGPTRISMGLLSLQGVMSRGAENSRVRWILAGRRSHLDPLLALFSASSSSTPGRRAS